MLTLPLNTRLLTSQNYSPFLSWMTKGKSLRGHCLFITRRDSILILIITSAPSSSEASREGDGEATKPPKRACHCAIRLIRVFTWHNSSLRVSRRASMHWSYTMTTSRVTPPTEEEGAEVEGMVGARAYSVSVCGHFVQNWASLRRTETALMTPTTV